MAKATPSQTVIVQVCDSDTVLDPACTMELLKIIEQDPKVGGAGGDVQILNKYDSWISFLSSVRYWMAFNVERACQSYFGCVQCISGPLGILLPAKMFAIATINKAGWGTSGRKKIVINFIGLIPVTVWFAILLGGISYTIYCETQDPFSETEIAFLITGAIIYASYWIILLVLYLAIVAKRCSKREEQYNLAYAEA
ncbi:UNVERIFIED_CONTAM: hypothetical protein FKN15_043600 [Acipenser sinensis]